MGHTTDFFKIKKICLIKFVNKKNLKNTPSLY